jgi:hypothetical protein
MVAVPTPASAADSSFDGTCSFQGTAKFGRPLSNTNTVNTYQFSGPGTCTGTVNGAAVTDAPVTVFVAGPFEGNCSSTHSTGPAPGRTTFTQGNDDPADDVVIRFTVEFTGTGPELDLRITGDKSGTGSGRATFLTSRTSPDILLKCGGDGNSELPFDAMNSTNGPVVSEVPSTPSGAAPHRPKARGPVVIETHRASASRLHRRRSVAVRLHITDAIRKVRVRLVSSATGRTVAGASAGSLTHDATVRLRERRHATPGAYLVVVTAEDSAGQRFRVTSRLRLQR